ncbi:MAG TPA: hypothetical protein VGN50_05270, partial [Pedococcus sp.]|nr:hypothetical protein [Pedococcus sp.]
MLGAAGWGGLTLAVLVGAASSGVSGAAIMFATFALVVALVSLVRGRVDWAHLRSRGAGTVALGASLLAFTLGAVAAPAPAPTSITSTAASGPSSPAASQPASPTTTATTSAPRPSASPATTKAARPSATARPPATRVVPAAGGDIIDAAGAVLPNSARTPGATNASVTQANIASTICVAGWTATVRPPSSVTTRLKIEQLATGYAYRGDTAAGDYEEDHLISLELGGSPTAAANLWPEPYNTAEGARVKDRVENRLHTLVCNHSISLATAQ